MQLTYLVLFEYVFLEGMFVCGEKARRTLKCDNVSMYIAFHQQLVELRSGANPDAPRTGNKRENTSPWVEFSLNS